MQATVLSPTRQRQSKQRIDKILDAALKLFCEKGIEETSIEDVARLAEVGPATIYRYFDTKAELAIQSAMVYWSCISNRYLTLLSTESTDFADSIEPSGMIPQSGADALARILDIFVHIFEEESAFLKFLHEFDIFIKRYAISPERLASYEEQILNLKPYVTKALEQGLTDGSLSFSWSVDELYFSLTHTLLSLMMKLAGEGDLLLSDQKVSLVLQVQITTKLLLQGLRSTAK